MNFENTGKAILMVFDELQNDEQSTEIIDAIDGGESDAEIVAGLKKGILRLRELGKEEIAKQVESLM
jgi:hypothetical protein